MNRQITTSDARQLADTIQYLRYKVSPDDLNDLRELLPLLLDDNPEEVMAAHYAFVELLVNRKGQVIPMPLHLSPKQTQTENI